MVIRRLVLLAAAAAAFAVPASATVVLTDPGSGVYYVAALTAGDEVKVDKLCVVTGDVHANKKVVVETDGRVEGDVSAVEAVDLKGTVTGTVTRPAPVRKLPLLLTETQARALADRIYESDHDFVNATVDEVVFVDGKAKLYGSLAGVGTIIASGDVEVMEVPQGGGAGLLAPGARLSLIAFKHVKVLQHRALRGALYAGADVILEKGVAFEGTAVARGKIDVKEGARVTFLDPDQAPPAIAGLVPADGSFAAAGTVIAASFGDDLSGVDPSSVVLVVDGADRTAEAAVDAAGLTFQPPAPLADGTHTVSVSLADRSGKTAAAAWSFTVDLARPAVAVVAPLGRSVGETPPTASIVYADAGTGIDVSTLRVDLDGAATGVVCDAGLDGAACTFPQLASGLHRLDVEVRDRAGNAASTRQEFTFVSDLLPPVLAITAPADGALLDRRLVRLEGTASDESNLTLAVNGLGAGLSGGAFGASLNLSEGPNELRVTAVDEAGRSAEASVAVTVDSRPPALSVDSPRSGAFSNQPSILVVGVVDDAGGLARLEIGGEQAAVDDGHFAHELALAEGPQLVVVRAVDLAGNATEVPLELTRFTLPVVTIEAPPDLAYVASSTVEVRGTVSDLDATVTVNGVPAVLSGNGFAAAGVPLIEGGNVLTATVVSPLGRAGSDTVHVVRDLTPPRLAVHHPRDGARLAADHVAVSGMVNDIVTGTVNAPQASVTVNGVAAEVANRSFFAPAVPLVPGDNLLTVTATDASGNVGGTQVLVRRETAAVPRVAVISGDRQTAVAGTALADPLVVELRDAAGLPVAGRTVLFKVVGTDGALDGGERRRALETGPDGRAAVHFTLGSRVGVGNQVVEVFASQFTGAVFTASATPGPPAAIVVDAGSQQLGTAGQALPRPLVAAVTDAGHNRLEGVPVRFRVAQGTGRFENGLQEIVVDTDGDGRAIVPFLLGPEETPEADVVDALLPGGEGAPRATFVNYGRAAGDPALTAVAGVVLDNSNVPVPGVTLRVFGTSITAQSDAEGLFRIQPAPVGTVKLVVDGSTATRPGPWPDLEFTFTTIAGRETDVGMPVFLVPLTLGEGIVVSETQGGVVTLADVPGFALEVAPGSATFPGGGRSGVVSVTAVHGDKVPMVPNFGQQPRIIVTIQPPGTRFDPPARLTLPNLESLPPGRVTELYSFDHDLGHFVSIGPATVSEDGLAIVSDPGVGILKAGWHCGGDPAAAGTPADCGPCEICNGSVCVPGCSLASSASSAARADDLVARIFGAQCTCDDKDDCTINDRCNGSGGCIGDPVQVTAVNGSCVGAVGASLSFTATGNAPDRASWTAPSGNPASGKGASFSTSYSAAGDYTVTAACKSSSKSKMVAVDVDCSTITPMLNEIETNQAPQAGATGQIRRIRHDAKYKGCVDGDEWCFRLEEFIEEHAFGIASEASVGRTDISGPNDTDVTPATCALIISDFTPPPPGTAAAPPRTMYISMAATRVHERFHVDDFRNRVVTPTMNQLTAFVSQQTHCTDCKSAVPTATFDAEMERLWMVNLPRYFDGNHEVRAYDHANPAYAALANQIRQRARNAPPAEGWPAACM